MDEQATMSANEAAVYLGLTNKRVYQLVRSGELKATVYMPRSRDGGVQCKAQLAITAASVEARRVWMTRDEERRTHIAQGGEWFARTPPPKFA